MALLRRAFALIMASSFICATPIKEKADMSKAKIRDEIEQIQNVTRTWFEFSVTGTDYTTILVIETDLDTDPNNNNQRNIRNVISEIQHYLLQPPSHTMTIHEV